MIYQCGFCSFSSFNSEEVANHWENCSDRKNLDRGMERDCYE